MLIECVYTLYSLIYAVSTHITELVLEFHHNSEEYGRCVISDRPFSFYINGDVTQSNYQHMVNIFQTNTTTNHSVLVFNGFCPVSSDWYKRRSQFKVEPKRSFSNNNTNAIFPSYVFHIDVSNAFTIRSSPYTIRSRIPRHRDKLSYLDPIEKHVFNVTIPTQHYHTPSDVTDAASILNAMHSQ